MHEKKTHYAVPILSVLVVIAVFGNSLLNGFVWDDKIYLLGNNVYMQFDLKGMFLSLANGVEYLPLRDLTYAFDYLVWGERASGFHLMNLFFYSGNLLALYFLLAQIVRLRGLRGVPGRVDGLFILFALLFFAVHPIHSEPVAWITGRNVLLSGLFFFLSCYCYVRFLNEERGTWTGWCWAALVFYLCALLSKATSIVLPLVLLLLLYFDAPGERVKKLRSLVPFFLLMLVFFIGFKRIGLITEVIDQQSKLPASRLTEKLAVSLQIPFFYLKKLAFPVGFSAEYDTVFALRFADPAVLAAFAGLALLAGAAVAVRKRYPELLFGLGWFLLTLIPVLHFLPTNPFVADRYAYLPTFGVFFFAASVAGRLAGERYRPAAVVCGVLLVVVWSCLSFSRNQVWRSETTLWEDAIRVSPRQINAYLNLGSAYFEEGNHEKAFLYFGKIREMGYYYDYYSFFQGELHLQRGDLAAALDSYKRALATNEHHLEALARAAEVLERLKKRDQAMIFYGRILQSRDQDLAGLRGKAKARLEFLQREFGKLDDLKKRASENPGDIRFQRELAFKLHQMGFQDEALALYLQLEKSEPNNWQLLHNIANISFDGGKYREAAAYYQRSLSIHPSNVQALNNLGLIFKEAKEYPKAVDAFSKAMAMDGGFPSAPYNLAMTYAAMNDRSNARKYLAYTRERFPQLADKVEAVLKDLN